MITIWTLSIIIFIVLFYRFKKEVKTGNKKPKFFDNDVYTESIIMVLTGTISAFGFLILILLYLP